MRLLYWAGMAMAIVLVPPLSYTEDSVTSTELNNKAVLEGRAGHLEQAVLLLHQALKLTPHDPSVRKNLSYALTEQALQRKREGKVAQAFELLEEALEYYPNNGPALVSLGDLYYLERNEFGRALEAWKQAYGLLPEAQQQGLAQRMAQAKRDQEIERRFSIQQVGHFQIRLPDDQDQEAALKVGQRLEKEYHRLAQELEVYPSSLTVILYRGKEFERLSTRLDWALGFYDGRIRIRMNEVGTQQEARICAHELAHAFLHAAYGNRIPIWVHEGYAQIHEPPHPLSKREETLRENLASGAFWVPLVWLDSRFEQPSDASDVERAYSESRLVVDFLVATYGMDRFKGFLERLASCKPVEAAFDESFSPSRWSRINQGIPKGNP